MLQQAVLLVVGLCGVLFVSIWISDAMGLDPDSWYAGVLTGIALALVFLVSA